MTRVRRKGPSERKWANKVGTPALIELGNRIRERRIAAGLTAGQAAERAGNYSQRTWFHWEAGERSFAIEQLLSICAMFDCTLNELAGDLTIQSAHPLPKDLQRQSMEFLRSWWQLPENKRRAVRRLVKILLKQEQENFERL